LAFDNAELRTNSAVPDGGTTLVLLGAALTGLGALPGSSARDNFPRLKPRPKKPRAGAIRPFSFRRREEGPQPEGKPNAQEHVGPSDLFAPDDRKLSIVPRQARMGIFFSFLIATPSTNYGRNETSRHVICL
jgi:hypothetical protein